MKYFLTMLVFIVLMFACHLMHFGMHNDGEHGGHGHDRRN